jgi:hypothetical protein
LAILVATVTPGGRLYSEARKEFSRRQPRIAKSLTIDATTLFPVRMTEATIAASKPGMAFDLIYEIAKRLYIGRTRAFIRALRMRELETADLGDLGRLATWLREAISTCAHPGLRRDLLVRLYYYAFADELAAGRVAASWPATLPAWFSECPAAEQRFLECTFAAEGYRAPVLWTFYGGLNAVQTTAIDDGRTGSTFAPDIGPLFRIVVRRLETAWRRALACMAGKQPGVS